eukprot:2907277-Rhodomonas_salina.1
MPGRSLAGLREPLPRPAPLYQPRRSGTTRQNQALRSKVVAPYKWSVPGTAQHWNACQYRAVRRRLVAAYASSVPSRA